MRRRSIRKLEGMYLTSADYLNSTKWDEKNQIIEPHLECGFIHTQPKSIYNQDPWPFQIRSTRYFPPASLTTLEHGRVIGSHGSVVTEDGYLIFDLSNEYVDHRDHSLFHNTWKSNPRWQNGTMAVLTCSVADCYYHWLFDVIVRLHLLEKAGISYKNIVLNTTSNAGFQQEYLNLLGINRNTVINCQNFMHLQADRLIVPSLVGYKGDVPKWASDYLRCRLLGYANRLYGFERIYVSRRNARHRKLVNEDQVVNILQQYGFKTVFPEDMSVVDQISLFSSAEVIITPHGSALANLAFATPSAKVIELFAPNYINEIYWVLSNHVGLDYYYLIGEGETVHYGNLYEDIIVDIGKLERTLELAGISRG